MIIAITVAANMGHDQPWLVLVTVAVFWLITLRTLVALTALQNRSTEQARQG